MYGPPPDPAQIPAPASFAEAPLAWIGCVLVGLALARLAGPRRPLLFVTGCVLALTTPLGALLPTYVYGAFPTVDKAGSLAFYLDGVHRRMMDLDDPGMRLIGIHVGHLWITAAFDLVLAPFAAMNAQGFLDLVLSWWAAARLFESWTKDRRVSLLFAFPFAMNLHQFRDLNWYTIEKTAIYWLPLYVWSLGRLPGGALVRFVTGRTGGAGSAWAYALPPLLCAGAFFVNVYVGILCALAGALALLARDRAVTIGVATSALAVLPLAAWQWRLMHGGPSLGDPETFLTQRAALDVLTPWPPAWNRLEAWRAFNLVAVAFALLGVGRTRRLWAGAAVAGVLALGPTHNPVYLALYEAVPGFWRVAKPETFVHLAWLLVLGAAALTATRIGVGRTRVVVLGALFALGWVLSVRTHPAYPGFSRPTEVRLAPEWRRGVPGMGP